MPEILRKIDPMPEYKPKAILQPMERIQKKEKKRSILKDAVKGALDVLAFPSIVTGAAIKKIAGGPAAQRAKKATNQVLGGALGAAYPIVDQTLKAYPKGPGTLYKAYKGLKEDKKSQAKSENEANKLDNQLAIELLREQDRRILTGTEEAYNKVFNQVQIDAVMNSNLTDQQKNYLAENDMRRRSRLGLPR